MAFSHGKNVAVLVNEDVLTPYFNDMSISRTADMAETTAFGKNDKSYIVGIRDATISLSGMWDGASGAVDEELAVVLGGSNNVVTIVPATTAQTITAGNIAYPMAAPSTSYDVSGSIGDVVSVSSEFQVTAGTFAGVIINSDSLTSSGTDDTTAEDNTASTAAGAIANLHVTANTFSGVADIKVQHSADNMSFADIATFTQVGASTATSESVTVSSGSTINRYIRANRVLGAGTGSITTTVSFARK